MDYNKLASLIWQFLASTPTIGWLLIALLIASGPEKIIKNLEDWGTSIRRFRLWIVRKGWPVMVPRLLVLGESPEKWHFKDDLTKISVSIDALPFYFDDDKIYDIWINYKSVRSGMAGRFEDSYWQFFAMENNRIIFEEVSIDDNSKK